MQNGVFSCSLGQDVHTKLFHRTDRHERLRAASHLTISH
jgi:hypothetical protein